MYCMYCTSIPFKYVRDSRHIFALSPDMRSFFLFPTFCYFCVIDAITRMVTRVPSSQLSPSAQCRANMAKLYILYYLISLVMICVLHLQHRRRIKTRQRSSLLLGGRIDSMPCRASYFPPRGFEKGDELHQDVKKNRMISSLSSNHPGAK